jgi:hypothetical protein
MSAKFDMFMRLPDEHPIWIQAVETVREARHLLRQFARSSPGDYFVFDTRCRQVIAAWVSIVQFFAVLLVDFYTQLQITALTRSDADIFDQRLSGLALARG